MYQVNMFTHLVRLYCLDIKDKSVPNCLRRRIVVILILFSHSKHVLIIYNYKMFY